MILFSILAFVALVIFLVSFVVPVKTERGAPRPPLRVLALVIFILSLIPLAFSSFVVVKASHQGVVTTFGKVSQQTLPEGGHFVFPWQQVHPVLIGMDVAAAEKSQAGSKDLQSVHADLTVNFHVIPGRVRELYQQVPSLNYTDAFVVPAVYETFKAVVALYTAEELVTKRQEVSANITKSLNDRLMQYHLQVQTVNLVNFGFSRAFDLAIEEKVTANQKAQTAENNLKRVKFEADARIAQAEGEAKAIAIQSAAIEKSGGAGYVQLQAIAKWNGALPAYMTSGAAAPFIGIK